MKKTSRLSLVIALEIIALEIGASIYAALLYHDLQHVLLLTGLLCLVAGMIGTVVTRAKALAASCAILVLGLIALGIGLYFRVDLHYDERAAAALGFGVLGFLGGAGWYHHTPIEGCRSWWVACPWSGYPQC